jgi:hypothetical protein
VLAFVIGKRIQDSTNLLLDRVVHVTDDHIPFFIRDQLPEYRTALLHAYGTWYQPQRRGKRGRYPEPQWMQLPGLLYAQVVKMYKKDRVIEVGSQVSGISCQQYHQCQLCRAWQPDTMPKQPPHQNLPAVRDRYGSGIL